jgi:hypothetical protein
MSYIGRGTESISNVEVLDNLTFDGSASYTLQKSSTNFVPSSANNLLISISGVVQQGNFSVSGSTITFDTTVSASDTCDWILHYGTGLITTVADGAITEAKLGSNAVTTAKINNGAITSSKLDSGLALGKIGQVVQAVKTDTQSTTSTSFVDISGISVSITPSSTSSKIFITANISGGHVINDTPCYFQLKRDTTDIYLGTTATGSRINASGLVFEGNDSNHAGKVSMSFVDEPSSTSAITYKVQFKSFSGSAVYINRSSADVDAGYNARQASSLIVMEVLA